MQQQQQQQEPDPNFDEELGKFQWPELEGKDKDVAKDTIEKDNPKVTNIILLKEGAIVTADYRTDRVRIFYNTDDKVVGVPRIT